MRLAPLVAMLSVGVVLPGCACFECPIGHDFCDGDLVKHCGAGGTGGGLCINCPAVITVVKDCAKEGEKLGVEKTCRAASLASNDNGGPYYASCVDKAQVACKEIAASATCDAQGRLQNCLVEEAKDHFFLDTVGCRDGGICQLGKYMAECVDSPLTPCDGGSFCDGDVQHWCAALADGGSATITQSCLDGCSPDGGVFLECVP